jgi:hypothetical protein
MASLLVPVSDINNYLSKKGWKAKDMSAKRLSELASHFQFQIINKVATKISSALEDVPGGSLVLHEEDGHAIWNICSSDGEVVAKNIDVLKL